MARTWLSVTVELLGGRGEQLWPWPGRVFAVGPSHTFGQLADAINAGFARWDRAHLSMFTLVDGRLVTDPETGDDLVTSAGGPFGVAVDITTARVARSVEPGAEFQYTFDFGDDWIHRCTVAAEKVDPLDVVGIVPTVPMAYWGWRLIPDQYQRRWADDDGTSQPPTPPTATHPMLRQHWPESRQHRGLDLVRLRAAVTTRDITGFFAAVDGVDLDDALQQVASGIPMLLEHRDDRVETFTVSVINRLTRRNFDGDVVLAQDLIALLRHDTLASRAVPVDLEMLCAELEGDAELSTGSYLDLQTGEVINDVLTDPAMVGDDVAVDVDDDPDRWLRVEPAGSRNGWHDMAAFAGSLPDRSLRSRTSAGDR